MFEKNKQHHVYQGSEDYWQRRAEVWDSSAGWIVILINQSKVYDIVTPFEHSEQYAEDTAENFVMGYGTFAKLSSV